MSSLFNLATVTAAGGHRLRAGYRIDRSVRLRTSATGYFSRSAYPVASAGTQWTLSMWMKRGALSSGDLFSFVSTTGAAQQAGIQFDSNDAIRWWQYAPPSYQFHKVTSALFRDPSAWYHIVFVYDTTLATAADRCQVWVNGIRQTAFSTSVDPSLNLVTYYKTGTLYPHIGGENRNASSVNTPFDGYLTEINFIDGQALTPSSFGETNTFTGVWQPKKYVGTYGTNGFYLNFSDNSAATAAAIGKDSSGNGNNWTPNNISVTAGVTFDSMLDSPTQFGDGGNGRGNYAVANPVNAASGLTVNDGNLKIAASAGGSKFVNASIAFPSSGAYYAEITFANASTSQIGQTFGIALGSRSLTALYNVVGSFHFYASNTGSLLSNGTETGGLSAISAAEVFQVAVDVTNSKMWIGRSNVWYNSTGGTTGNPATGANPTFTGSFVDYFIFAGFDTSSAVSANLNFGQRPFTYTPPTGFKTLNTLNLP